MQNLIKVDDCLKIMYCGQIVGGVCIHSEGKGTYLIGPLFISPEFQDLGIGTKAMRAVERYLADKKLLRLNTAYKNYRNHHFYEKLGFKKMGEWENGAIKLWLYEKRYR